MLSIHEDEASRYDSRAPEEPRFSHMGDSRQSRTATASRYDSRAPQESRTTSMGDYPQSRTATSSRYDSRAPQESRTTSMGDYPQSRTATASRYDSRAPQDSRYTSMGDTQQSRTPTYMDPSKPLVIDCAPKPRHQSRASTSPSQTVMERSRDNEGRSHHHEVSRSSYEEITIRITRKSIHRSSHRS